MSVTWEAAQRIRSAHGLGEPGFTVTNAICAAMTAEMRAWQKANDPALRAKRLQRMWRTAQLVDGRIVGSWAETLLEAQIELEVWWSAAVAWIVEDPDVLVHRRYLGEVSTAKTRSREAITFPVTSGPVDHPLTGRNAGFRAGRIRLRRSDMTPAHERVESLYEQRQDACECAKCEAATNQPKVSSGRISAFFDARNEHAHRGLNLVVGEALTGGSALGLSNNSGLSVGLFPKASCSEVGQCSCNKVHEGNQDLHTLTIPYAGIRVLSNQTVIALERQDS